MAFLNWVSGNVEIVALFVSFITVIFTVIFSLLQQKHNKNSVRPICEIIVSDYEDNIAVKITNVGTGPMTINKLRCKNSHEESDTLISLMPKVPIWKDFVGNVDGRTIPVEGKITLIEFIPQDYMTKKEVRKALKDIEINVIYSDIYKIKFKRSRKIDFFGRTLEK
jgi:hypothetical protein